MVQNTITNIISISVNFNRNITRQIIYENQCVSVCGLIKTATEGIWFSVYLGPVMMCGGSYT